MGKPIDVVLVGAGQRGADVYGAYALRHPDQLRFVSVAEPDQVRRDRFSAQHGISVKNRYPSWEPLFAGKQQGRAALICTQDRDHFAPAIAALQAGYDVLLEKPMATTPEDCHRLVQVAEQTSRQLHVCHVLRYTAHFRKLRELVASGVLGQIVHVDHRENVSWWHMAHSYVRGNWASAADSSPMILAKCCHDFDILLWVLDRYCERLSSVGGLQHFRPENAPPGAPSHCLEGCPIQDTCPYYAPFIYQDLHPLWRGIAESGDWATRLVAGTRLRAPGLMRLLTAIVPEWRQARDHRVWPRAVVNREPSTESLLESLRTGPYGRCVYHCENDVVDHQVVSMQFTGGLSVTLTMQGHAQQESRTTQIEGSLASISAESGLASAWIEVHEHRSGRRRRYKTSGKVGDGHGGGDSGLMAAFVRSLQTQGDRGLVSARDALESHLLAFAAERARQEGRVVEMGPPA